MTVTCEAAREQIEARHFIGWRGLPSRCTPDVLFGLPIDERWGELPLGRRFEPARSRLLELDGYYRPLAYVRSGAVVLFDGMNPALSGDWNTLSADLGQPDATQNWIHGTIDMPGGLRIYAGKGITIFLNPENDFVIHVSLYEPCTVEDYIALLLIDWNKRGLRSVVERH
jgi:hypothetical protein